MIDYALDAYFGHPPVALWDALLRSVLKAGVITFLLLFGFVLFRVLGPDVIYTNATH